MQSFKEGSCHVLVATDVAGMGIDVSGLTFAVNIGIPKNPWKFQQQVGRIGRGGEKSICVTLVFPQKGGLAADRVLSNMLRGSSCYRKGLNQMFVLKNPFIDYTKPDAVKSCDYQECESKGVCQCSYCSCCSFCSDKCECQFSIHDPAKMVETILGFGDERYRFCHLNVYYSRYLHALPGLWSGSCVTMLATVLLHVTVLMKILPTMGLFNSYYMSFILIGQPSCI